MRFADLEGLQRLITNRIPESTSLEYKSDLILSSETQRAELLKDLTGIANGGGGTVIFGMDEESETSVAKELTPLDSAAIESQVEDIVRDAIHPPLIWEHRLISCDGGWIFLADVEPSVIGPYRIDAYREGRYYKRLGKKTFPMSEQEIRDAYTLAARSAENRSETWDSHFPPTHVRSEDPWIVISALPREPLTDLFDALPIDIGRYLSLDESLHNYHEHTQLRDALSRMKYWGAGVAGDDSFRNDDGDYTCSVRLHRNGAACIAHRLPHLIDVRDALRVFNALLIYLSNFWRSHSLRRPVEIHADFLNLGVSQLSSMPNGATSLELVQPAGVKVGAVSLKWEIMPSTLEAAHERHRMAERLATHLSLAYGLEPTGELFDFGFLFGRDGRPSPSMLGTGDLLIDKENGSVSVYAIDESSKVVNPGGAQVFVSEGVLLDHKGDTLAVLEMATGLGCPTDFIPRTLSRSGARHRPDVTRRSSLIDFAVPAPSGVWSHSTLIEHMA